MNKNKTKRIHGLSCFIGGTKSKNFAFSKIELQTQFVADIYDLLKIFLYCVRGATIVKIPSIKRERKRRS